ncbi:hypothetical protein OIU77_003764 [Salix suchowensis]|uniref:Uncharacterized protein n=1 Tax=Salix suchowensis TaxID=1278906 RepID=A0ABQ9AUU2_9ROSI|nr:hypothetical protein OIU77_003764 [Salix suchowensis]
MVSFLTTDKQKSPTSIHFSPTTPTASPSLSFAVSASLHGVNVIELVTFSPYPLAKAPDVSNAGRHLSAAKFHSVLQNAEGMDEWKECPDCVDSEEKEEAVFVFELQTISSDTILSPQVLGEPVKNASGFKGRTASLSRKLKSIVELILVDAPLELPFIYQPVVSELGCSDESSQQFLPSIAVMGPFDGILGFSRGEAIKGDIDFRFAILCAGFRLFH